MKNKEIKVELDLNVTKELEAEGFAREISRKIQALRKTSGLERRNVIELFINGDEQIENMLKTQLEFIKNRTGAEILLLGKKEIERYKNKERFSIRGKEVLIGFNKKR
ncbi:MAG: DUF5915 domain-containing protein [Nanoarchaeota archaeon]